ncbi:MAG: hypothetical protein V1723_04140 [Candidatus Uhrbacteria bacterium]
MDRTFQRIKCGAGQDLDAAKEMMMNRNTRILVAFALVCLAVAAIVVVAKRNPPRPLEQRVAERTDAVSVLCAKMGPERKATPFPDSVTITIHSDRGTGGSATTNLIALASDGYCAMFSDWGADCYRAYASDSRATDLEVRYVDFEGQQRLARAAKGTSGGDFAWCAVHRERFLRERRPALLIGPKPNGVTLIGGDDAE